MCCIRQFGLDIPLPNLSLFSRLYYIYKLVMKVLFVMMGVSGENVKVWFAYK